jgi:hypothetical protein
VSNNSAFDEGGGIWNGSGTSLTINDSSIANNSANSSGGGILAILHCKILIIAIRLLGGGIYNYSLNMLNTIGNNSAAMTGGLLNVGTLIAAISQSANSAGTSTAGDWLGGGILHGAPR